MFWPKHGEESFPYNVLVSGGEAKLTSLKLIPTVPLAEVNIMMISTYQILTEDLSKTCILPKQTSIIETR